MESSQRGNIDAMMYGLREVSEVERDTFYVDNCNSSELNLNELGREGSKN